ncbi:hypothetical protein SAMN05421505_10534 [Sinosporangium album]|uniref:Uncharacterized protein n=1 Tax=Sinosporangium album TaxID=504805 RepID=A0A1G7UYP1_9ACTN|nr:hypothetical protein [Sinosporangium album]SDG52617.1 hypothetical protein SAMN05421505_10534 [Sinosporangium album]
MTWFVYRSHYEGPLSKRVRRLPDATALDWFRRGFEVAGDALADIETWVSAELGGDVHGLSSVFVAAREHRLPPPADWDGLREVLQAHLRVDGEVRVEPSFVRALTDDDEIQLAYYFCDDSFVGAHPDLLAFHLWEGWRLPDVPLSIRKEVSLPAQLSQLLQEFQSSRGETLFTPLDQIEELSFARAGGEGTTYALLLTFADGASRGRVGPVAIPGTRLPDLAARLREPVGPDAWPSELLILRALVAPGERDLTSALGRCNLWPSFTEWPVPVDLAGDHAVAHEDAMRHIRFRGPEEGRDPGKTLIHTAAHTAQMSIHLSGFFGYQQWILFDDVWARAYESLARSLLRFASSDPVAPAGRLPG